MNHYDPRPYGVCSICGAYAPIFESGRQFGRDARGLLLNHRDLRIKRGMIGRGLWTCPGSFNGATPVRVDGYDDPYLKRWVTLDERWPVSSGVQP